MNSVASERVHYAKSRVPEGRAGEWAVERFRISDNPRDADIDTRPAWARASSGEYTRLRSGAVDYMTDLYEEWWSQRPAMEEALSRGGDVLVTGLGLGLFVETILASETASISSVTVLELAPEVIELVGAHLAVSHSDRLRIVRADAFEWTPPAGCRFTVAWHDIWPNPFDPASVEESHRLMERYAPVADWQGSWALEYRAMAGVDDLEGRG